MLVFYFINLNKKRKLIWKKTKNTSTNNTGFLYLRYEIILLIRPSRVNYNSGKANGGYPCKGSLTPYDREKEDIRKVMKCLQISKQLGVGKLWIK